jgi:hypothetical protein
MPRKPKPKPQKKFKTVVPVSGTTISVTLYPPKPPRMSWYAFWPGLKTSRSTGQIEPGKAIEAVVGMLNNDGKLGHAEDLVLTDEEFEEIQRRHFAKKKDPAAAQRAQTSLKSCLEAISAFRDIAAVSPVSLATPDDCERFQTEAQQRPWNWRKKYAKGNETNGRMLGPNTILKWSRELQAAFERANVNGGKKCVRGVVEQRKLLTSNPWKQFTWIDGNSPSKRRLTNGELLSILDYLDANWPYVVAAQAYAKVSLWVWGRRSEVATLRWENLRVLGDEYHFDYVGKWGVRKWARIPKGLYKELMNQKTGSPFVFAAYNDQLRAQHAQNPRRGTVNIVGQQFSPAAFYEWFAKRMVEWAKAEERPHATHHAFRRTALQAARRGEDRNERVARDARVSRAVMMEHYVDETDEELRQASNRTFYRLIAGMAPEVSERYGYQEAREVIELEEQLGQAVAAKDWHRANKITKRLAKRRG